MTQFAESRCPFGADRIQENLLRLSAMQALPWEFRATLAKLGARWSELCTGECRRRLGVSRVQ